MTVFEKTLSELPVTAQQSQRFCFADVIPKRATAMLRGETVYLSGERDTSRDFCIVANISKVRSLLGYAPTHRITRGLDAAVDWYLQPQATASVQ